MAKTQIKKAITLKNEAQLALMREAGRTVAEVLELVGRAAQPGVTTLALDRLAEAHIRGRDAVPSFKGYRGFPATLCTSINEEIVHGIPSKKRRFKRGGIFWGVCGGIFYGYYG